jgi:glucose-1-phosphate thymidylyltransferase
MAGLGTRLRPHTWSKPKQLISVAGKTVLDHVLDTLSTLPQGQQFELINIVGYLGDQIETYVAQKYPHIESHYVIQDNPRGQSHAIHLAKDLLSGPMLMIFADTLIETDLSFLAQEQSGAVAWVKEVDDPRRFGVAEVGEDGWVQRLIEKPDDVSNRQAVVGFYYFKRSEDLLAAIETQMERGISLKGEFFLADAVNIMLERGLKMRTEAIDIWLDAGTPEAVLETNRYLLSNGHANCDDVHEIDGSLIIPPVFIHPSTQVVRSVIGPNVSLGAGCRIENSILRDVILEDEAEVHNVVLENSLIGRKAKICQGASSINAGDHTVLTL